MLNTLIARILLKKMLIIIFLITMALSAKGITVMKTMVHFKVMTAMDVSVTIVHLLHTVWKTGKSSWEVTWARTRLKDWSLASGNAVFS